VGQEKSSGTTVVNQSSSATPTAEETALNQLRLGQLQETAPYETEAIKSGLTLSNLLLGGQPLPGYLGGLPLGIGEDQTQSMVNSALRDITPGFQSSGLLDSGVRASISARTAGDIRNQNAAFNVQNLQQLLNIATGSQAQPLQAPMNYSSQLGASLAGLRSTNTSGTTTQNYRSNQNPFLNSLAGGFGQGFGGGFSSGLTSKYF